MMSCLGPVTWLKNETSDNMYVSTINEFGSSEGREKVIPAGKRLVMRYRQGMDRSAKVRFRVRAEGRADLENKEISPYTVFECSDINIRYKLGDGSVVKDYADGVLLDFDLEKGTDQVSRIGLFRWFRGCYHSCVALGKRCFAGQEANDDVQGQAQANQASNSPIPQPVICQAEAIPTIDVDQYPTISQPEIQHVISIGQDEAMSTVETSNSQIAQPHEIIQPVINDQAEVIPTVEAQYPPISQPDIQLVINCQAQAIPTTEVPNPPILLQPVNNAQTEILLVAEAHPDLIPQLKIQHVINGEAQAIHITEAPDAPISQPEIQHYVINCQAEATPTAEASDPPIPQPELQLVIKGQAEAKHVVEAPDPPIQQPEIQLVINSIPAVEEHPPISQSDVLVINYQAEATFVTEAPDPPIPQLVINCMCFHFLYI